MAVRAGGCVAVVFAMLATAALGRAEPAAAPGVKPLKSLGAASWDADFGLVEGASGAPSSSEAAAPRDATKPLVAPRYEAARGSMTELSWLWGFGATTYTVGTSTATTSVDGNLASMRVRPDFRKAGRPWGVWFELAGGYEWASSSGEKYQRYGGAGMLGVDYYPLRFVGVGPLLGYHGEGYHQESSTFAGSSVSDASDGFDHGLLYGGHVRVRSAETTDTRATLYVDLVLSQRASILAGALYSRLEAGLDLGGFLLAAWWEKRLTSNDLAALASDAQRSGVKASDVVPQSQPLAQSIGLSIGFLL